MLKNKFGKRKGIKVKGFFFVRKRPEKENIRKHRDFKMREDIGGPVTMKEYVCPSNGGGGGLTYRIGFRVLINVDAGLARVILFDAFYCCFQ